MTHELDCSVTPEAREKVDEIAKLFNEGEVQAGIEAAKDAGWEMIGGGAGRTTFRVDEYDDVTADHPCVVKMANRRGRFPGHRQNNQEIGQWESLPPQAKNAEPPVFVPVRDYANDRMSWLSMPEVDARGGDEWELHERLNSVGMKCEDIYGDNVGEMHGKSVILDYGLDCYEVDTLSESSDAMIRGLLSDGWESVSPEKVNGDWPLTFRAPAWTYGDWQKPPLSKMWWDAQRGFVSAELYFSLPAGTESPEAARVAERVEDDIHGWGGFDTWGRPKRVDGGFVIEVNIENYDEELFVTGIVRDVLDDLLDTVDEYVIGAGFTDDSEAKYADRIRELGGQNVRTEDLGVKTALVWDQPDIGVGLDENRPASRLEIMPQGAEMLSAAFGSWRPGEVTRPPLDTFADGITRDLQAQRDDASFEWYLQDVEGVRWVMFRVNGDPDDIGDVLTPEEMLDIYEQLLMFVRLRAPSAREGDEPFQSRLDAPFDETRDANLIQLSVQQAVEREVKRRMAEDGRPLP